jgi:hypothetical protein
MTPGERARSLPGSPHRGKCLCTSGLRRQPSRITWPALSVCGTSVYHGAMARGWESKSIESQQEDAAGAKVRGPELTAAERETLQKRRSLELALAQTQAELMAACRAAHRDMLQGRLAAIRQALDELP